jgi:hypothetical protein
MKMSFTIATLITAFLCALVGLYGPTRLILKMFAVAFLVGSISLVSAVYSLDYYQSGYVHIKGVFLIFSATGALLTSLSMFHFSRYG